MNNIIRIEGDKYKNIYVISDIHGHLEEFNKMLDLIKFNNEEDLIIVNGDTIDRGDFNIETLRKCIYEKNIFLIKGNHEEMFVEGLLGVDDDMFNCWVLNGGDKTYKEYEQLILNDKFKLLIDTKNRPLGATVTINGKDFIIVHAGIEYINGLNSLSEVVNMMGFQKDNLLWSRESFLKSKNSFNGYIIFGHTPVVTIKSILKEFVKGDEKKTLKELSLIWRKDNRIGIDCGIAFGGNLSCLRLNDMKEFYI